MPSLKDFGIELQSFAPIPNSVIIGSIKFGGIDIDLLQRVFKNVQEAFEQQGIGNSVLFIPDDISLQRFSKDGLCEIRDMIDNLIQGCDS